VIQNMYQTYKVTWG